MKKHDFYIGKAFDAFEYFGAHRIENGVMFRTYAPGAKKVWLIGDFNNWQEEEMIQEKKSGIFSCPVSDATEGMLYKYKIWGQDDSYVEHCDPFGFSMEVRPKNASRIASMSFEFKDEEWMKGRDKNYNRPLNIYEVHLGSWRTNEADENGWYSYIQIKDILIPYVLKNGYTHIEFLPLSEHPSDCSWGYQNTGFFSPTSRYGTPAQLMELIDACHRSQIGVIMDVVPVHFAVDDYGLKRYDGTALFEYPEKEIGISEWGSHNFNFARGEVRSFLQSAVNNWLSTYHFDGIRMDAVSRVIYWKGDKNCGVNEWGIEFLRVMNSGLRQLHPTAMLIAEDSTDYEKVCAPVEYDGLGFDYKWDMGWMNDTLSYFRLPPSERSNHYHKLTFSMYYFYKELYLLPLSHDEVVHGKDSIIQKMWGEYDEKFAQARAFYLYMYTHPGKKLNFMGNEFAQFREWDEQRGQDFDLLEYPMHEAFHRYMIELHHLYKTKQTLYREEYNKDYFKWLEVHGEHASIYCYRRGKREDAMVAAFNFSNQDVHEYRIEMEMEGNLSEIFNTDWKLFGGASRKRNVVSSIKTEKDKHNKSYIFVSIAKFSGKLFEFKPYN
ncbi:MAG: 1,4-alpha-glucan branching protein GlgB [Velocimicrobium sp.]